MLFRSPVSNRQGPRNERWFQTVRGRRRLEALRYRRLGSPRSEWLTGGEKPKTGAGTGWSWGTQALECRRGHRIAAGAGESDPFNSMASALSMNSRTQDIQAQQRRAITRRQFFGKTAVGLGGLALASLVNERLLAGTSVEIGRAHV